MKFLVIGLGSMGKRRIRNLQKLHAGEIIGFDARKARVLETKRQYHVKTYNKFNEALKEKPDAFVISTPPDLHKKYADIAIDNKIHFFTEVNLSSSEIKSLIKKIKEKSIIGVPSCTLLFHPAIIELKKIIQKNTIGKIYSIHHHFGHYLPNWHPWEDYRKFYVSKKSTGAAREIVPFELVWLTSIMPNGNTLINQGAGAKLREVTPSGDIVWEYVYKNEMDAPHTLYRANKYPIDYPGLAGLIPSSE